MGLFNIANTVVLIPVEKIRENPAQPRFYFDEKELEGLMASIEENGLLQPITVTKSDDCYRLIAGERRLRAFRKLGRTRIPAIVTDADETKAAVLAVIENIQRSDLDYFEEALAIRQLIEYYGMTQEKAAKSLGKAQCTIANKLRLLTLTNAEITLVRQYGFTERQARAILRLPKDGRIFAIEHIHKYGLNSAQTDKYIDTELKGGKKKSQIFLYKEKRLYINTINHTLKVMKKSGISFESSQRYDNGYLEYIIRIPQDDCS